MVIECDICGFKNPGDPNFCGGCNVDFRESKDADNLNANTRKPRQGKMKDKVSSKKESAENEKVINWCAIRASCNSFEMSFPLFFYLVIMLARGDKKLGFCHCPACNLGYREMLASIANGKENKKLTAQSREIVIKARGDKIDGLTFDISEFFKKIKETGGNKYPQEKQESIPQLKDKGKIMIEIDPDVLENAVFTVLSSEAGRKIIKEISKPRKKMRRVGFEPTDSCESRS